MADDFVNNFGLLGQVLFKKRNEREARQRLDEALSRELAKIAAQAGYEKEIAEMRERGAMDRTKVGESGAKDRLERQLSHAEKLDQERNSRALAQYMLERQANLEELGMKYDAEGNLLRTKAELENPFKILQTSTGARNALAAALSSIAQFEDKVGPVNPALFESLTGVRLGTTAEPVTAPPKTGRILLPSSKSTPPKPGETPRSPDNAAPEVPVKVGPKPLNSGVSIIGGDKATLQGGPEVAQPSFMELMQQAPQYERPQRSLLDTPSVGPADSIGAGLLDSIRGNTWGVGPSSKNIEALLEAYLQKSSPAIKK